MKMTMRWYGATDSIPLSYMKQIPGMTGVVSAVYDVPVGEVWSVEKIAKLKNLADEGGLALDVIESVPVHEDIKLGKPTRDKLIEHYAQTLRNLAKFGIKVVCYNFMPVFDWLRTDLKYVNADGSTCLAYHHDTLMKLDPRNLHLPGWDESYTSQEIYNLIEQYKDFTRDTLFENLVYFLKKIMPVCDETGINMAIHPSDPPWDMFGLPRVITCEADYERLIKEVPNKHNGFTFCTGSLGAGRDNDLPKMAEKYAKRIFFAHIRQLRYENELDFYEAGHRTCGGNLDIYGIVKGLVKGGFDGYVRPDHGRNIWGEDGKPGYGLYDRALGAMYLEGLFEAVENELKNKQ